MDCCFVSSKAGCVSRSIFEEIGVWTLFVHRANERSGFLNAFARYGLAAGWEVRGSTIAFELLSMSVRHVCAVSNLKIPQQEFEQHLPQYRAF